MKLKQTIIGAALAAGIALGGDAAAQDVSHLPPEKAETVLKLMKQDPNNDFTCSETENIKIPKREEQLSKLDPILVGKNIVFNKDTLNLKFTRQQFEAWRDNLDKVYDCYEEFTGTNPGIIYIAIRPGYKKDTLGHAHGSSFCLNPKTNDVDGFTKVAMHEMAHCFAYRKPWEVDQEVIVDILGLHACVKCRMTTVYDYLVKQMRRKGQDCMKVSKDNIPAFTGDHGYSPSAYRMYIYGLVGKIGIVPYLMAIRSYKDGGRSRRQSPEAARDFLDRLEYFSGKPGILRTLPDKGALLDKYFDFKIENQDYKKESIVAAEVSAIESAAAPKTLAEPPKTENTEQSGIKLGKPTRVWVNEEIEALNKGK